MRRHIYDTFKIFILAFYFHDESSPPIPPS